MIYDTDDLVSVTVMLPRKKYEQFEYELSELKERFLIDFNNDDITRDRLKNLTLEEHLSILLLSKIYRGVG
jgi:hypothetical protein